MFKRTSPVRLIANEAKILRLFSITGKDCGHIAGFSKAFINICDNADNKKPPKPHLHLDQEYPCSLYGVPQNFEIADKNHYNDFGIVKSLSLAIDENNQRYVQFETEQDKFYVKIHSQSASAH